jgi:hypothetical protein
MADAVDRWSASVAGDQDVQTQMGSLLEIHDWVPGIRY